MGRYFSPIPRELYPDGAVDTLYMSEFTLELYRHKSELLRHYSRCKRRHPPGDEIYRDEESRLAVFEVDGSKSKRGSVAAWQRYFASVGRSVAAFAVTSPYSG